MAATMPLAPTTRIFDNAEAEPHLSTPKAVIFDLDGVLADLCEMHRDLFIEAFEAVAAGGGCDARMTPALHAEKLEGLSTKTKLAACRALFPAAVFDADAVSTRKQERTIEILATMTFPTRAQAAFIWARGAGLQVAVYTNSIRATLDIVLRRLGIAHLCDATLSNEDVPAPKPSPSGYLQAFALLGRAPHECLIFEDSQHGLRAARGSGATVIPVLNSMDVTPDFVRVAVETRAPAAPRRVRIVMPLAGPDAGAKAFASTPSGEPTWHAVVRNLLPADAALRRGAEVHVIVHEALRARFDAAPLAGVNLHSTRGGAGPLATVLELRALLNDEAPLMIANADQFLDFDRGVDLFFRAAFHPAYDGAVSTFYNPDPADLRWSYMTVSAAGLLMSIKEKTFVGPYATTGVYTWAAARVFLRYADAVLRDGAPVGGRFYVAQVYAQAVAEGMRFRNIPCERIYKLGDAAAREEFLARAPTGRADAVYV